MIVIVLSFTFLYLSIFLFQALILRDTWMNKKGVVELSIPLGTALCSDIDLPIHLLLSLSSRSIPTHCGQGRLNVPWYCCWLQELQGIVNRCLCRFNICPHSSIIIDRRSPVWSILLLLNLLTLFIAPYTARFEEARAWTSLVSEWRWRPRGIVWVLEVLGLYRLVSSTFSLCWRGHLVVIEIRWKY